MYRKVAAGRLGRTYPPFASVPRSRTARGSVMIDGLGSSNTYAGPGLLYVRKILLRNPHPLASASTLVARPLRDN